MSDSKPLIPTLDLELTENQRRFLSEVVRNPGKRRHELADELGFSQQTAMRVVSPLAEAGIVVEIDEVTGARGKPPRLVHFSKSSLLTVAFVVAPERVTVSVCDLQGRQIVRETERREFKTCDEQLATVSQIFRRVAQDVPANARLVSCGFTSSGFFLERGRRVVSVVDPVGWSKVDRRAWAEALTHVPAFVENDGQVIATNLLAANEFTNFVCVLLDVGIGGAIVADGRLLRGKHGNAGEIGRLFPRGEKRPTERSLRHALGLANWDAWSGVSGLQKDARDKLDAWIDNAASQCGEVLTRTLELLDYEAAYICSRIPADILDLLRSRIELQPLGTSMLQRFGPTQEFILEAPKVLVRPIEDMAAMTHVLAARAFLEPEDDVADAEPNQSSQSA